MISGTSEAMKTFQQTCKTVPEPCHNAVLECSKFLAVDKGKDLIRSLEIKNSQNEYLFFHNSISTSSRILIHVMIIWCIVVVLFIGSEPTMCPANNSLLMCSTTLMYLTANNALLMHNLIMFLCEKWQIASLNCQGVIKYENKLGDWIVIKRMIELSYCKVWWSWLVDVSQIKYLPQSSASANNWSAHHWQITLFCSTLSSKC